MVNRKHACLMCNIYSKKHLTYISSENVFYDSLKQQSLVEWTFSEGTEISYVSTQFATILHFGNFFASFYEFE